MAVLGILGMVSIGSAAVAGAGGPGPTTGPPPPRLAVSPDTALTAGETVAVDGQGFVPGAEVAVVECAATTPGTAICDGSTAGSTQVVVGSDGSWTTPLVVTPTVETAGQSTDCTDPGVSCAVTARPAGTLAGGGTSVSTPVTFAARPPVPPIADPPPPGSTTATPATTPPGSPGMAASVTPSASPCTGVPDVTPSTASTTASQCQNLDAAGQAVTVSGTGFQPGTGLYVAECNAAVPAGGLCNEGFNGTPKFSEVTVGADGSWSTQLQVVPAVTLGTQTASCYSAGVQCAIQTSSVQTPTTRAQEVTLPIGFAAAATTSAATTTTSTAPTAATTTPTAGSGSGGPAGGDGGAGPAGPGPSAGSTGPGAGSAAVTGPAAQLASTGSSLTVPMAVAGGGSALAGATLLLVTGRRKWPRGGLRRWAAGSPPGSPLHP